MARSLNKVMLIGNLGSDPEVRTTPGGTRVAQFSLATNRQWTTDSGQKQEKTEWHRVVAWNGNRGTGLADIVEKYARKGDRMYVEGRIEYRSYEDKKDGQTKYVTEIRATDIVLLGGRGGDAATGTEGTGRRSAAPAPAQTAGKKGDEAFDDFPEALDEEDDDLPF
ncbi:MAG TPA: single-stranded DNA-binding protein [Gemmatimonadales bacterium]|nr:single-stranded DNA-binding protein [Gemmatimonadales bacterium]